MNVLGLKKVLLNKSPFRGGGEAFPRHVSLARALKDNFHTSLNGTLANRRPRRECIKKELSPEEKRLLYCTVNVNQ